MSFGEVATIGSVWVAMVCYFFGASGLIARSEGRWVRMVWSVGLISYLVHVCCAFQFYHEWSHVKAYDDTARQTDELLGWNWGGGLYANYLLTLFWTIDVVSWWRTSERNWNRWVEWGWQAFFFFMVFNATVVFGEGWARWSGVVGCLALVGLWLSRRRRPR